MPCRAVRCCDVLYRAVLCFVVRTYRCTRHQPDICMHVHIIEKHNQLSSAQQRSAAQCSAVRCRAVLSLSYLPGISLQVPMCMRRPACFTGSWSSWHLQVACLHLFFWTIYYICHSAPFLLVSERSGRNRPLREAPCIAVQAWYQGIM